MMDPVGSAPLPTAASLMIAAVLPKLNRPVLAVMEVLPPVDLLLIRTLPLPAI